MVNFLDKDRNALGFHWEFLGDSYMRVNVRNYGKGTPKVIVDVTELTGHRTSKARALRLARKYAEQYGIRSKDCSELLDHETDRKATKFDGSKTVVHIRQTSFAFEAV